MDSICSEIVLVVVGDDAAGQDDKHVREDEGGGQDDAATAPPSPNSGYYQFSMIGPGTSSRVLPLTELLPHLGCALMWGDARRCGPPLHPPHLLLLGVGACGSWCP